MMEQLKKLRAKAISEFKKATSHENLYQVEKKYLGRRGELARLIKQVKELAQEQRPQVGVFINEVKAGLDAVLQEAKSALLGTESLSSESFDITLPGEIPQVGHLHPLTQLRWQIEDIFRSLGFGVVDGPELESEWYNFEALNIPSHHPARDAQDTFYIKQDKPKPNNRLVLRTQTSPVQVRAMELYGAPLKIIVPGRVYRNEATDARHENSFWQVEGLVINKDISVAHLKGTMEYVIKELLGAEIRWRPGYFPFTEPSLEMDIECLLCRGKDCLVCKKTGWLEFMGSGLIHPNVLKAGGLDPSEWSGYAFGFGPERLHMLKYGVGDIRLYKSGDLRFLEQF